MSKNFFQTLRSTLTATEKTEMGKENWGGATYWRQAYTAHRPILGLELWGMRHRIPELYVATD